MSAVRALVTSATEDERKLEKERLLISHAETAAVIDDLVEQKRSELQVVELLHARSNVPHCTQECLESLNEASSRAFACRERLQKARNDIGLCKFFLQRKRDELRQLWRQDVEQRRVVEIIEQMYVMKQVHTRRFVHCSGGIHNATRAVDDALSHEHYLDAVQRLKRIMITSGAYLSSLGVLSQIRQKMHRLTEVRSSGLKLPQTHCCRKCTNGVWLL